MCLVLSKGGQLPTEPALLSCPIPQQHCPTQQVSVLPSPARLHLLTSQGWEQEQPFIPAPGMDAAAMCPSTQCLGAAVVLNSAGPAAPLQICWDGLGKPTLQSAVEVQSCLLLAWYNLRTLVGDGAPQPALYFNREGCEELTSPLRLEETTVYS